MDRAGRREHRARRETSFGYNMRCAGDVNGDGYDDLIVGAAGEMTGAGAAYFYFGGAGSTFDIGTDGTYAGAAGDGFGEAVY